MDDMSEFMQNRLKKLGFRSMRDFCKALGVPSQTLSLSLLGRRSAPDDHVQMWADGLRLVNEERNRFINHWRRERAKGLRGSSEYVDTVEARLSKAEKRVALASSLIASIAIEFGSELSPGLKKRIQLLLKPTEAHD